MRRFQKQFFVLLTISCLCMVCLPFPGKIAQADSKTSTNTKSDSCSPSSRTARRMAIIRLAITAGKNQLQYDDLKSLLPPMEFILEASDPESKPPSTITTLGAHEKCKDSSVRITSQFIKNGDSMEFDKIKLEMPALKRLHSEAVMVISELQVGLSDMIREQRNSETGMIFFLSNGLQVSMHTRPPKESDRGAILISVEWNEEN